MPFEMINGHRICYEVHGEGDVIIFLHHGFGCSKIWKNIYPRFVLEGYRIVMYDRRGYGESEQGDGFWELYESDQFRGQAVDELRAVKDMLGIGRFHIVGQCEGGVVGIDYTVTYPDDVRTLTTASTQCYSDVSMVDLNRQKFVDRFDRLSPDLQAKMVEWHGSNAEAAYNHFARYGGEYGQGFFDLRPVLPAVTCPTLIVYPDRSAIFDVEQAFAFYRHLPNGELAVFPRCGHNTYDQRPHDYTRTILDFLERNRDGAPRRVRPASTCLA